MCGRYTLTSVERAVAALFPDLLPPDDQPHYNIAPSQDIWAVINEPQKTLAHLKWGLVPFWADDPKIGNRMINARAETVAQKPGFREAFAQRRCLVLADGFYEWRKEPSGRKTPMYIRLKGARPFAFAGVWERWKDPQGQELKTCSIITTNSNDLVRPIHDRMPAIIPPAAFDEWLSRKHDPQKAQELLKPYPPEEMEAYPVSPMVNKPSVDDPKCIEGFTSGELF